jgi:precorrin-6B methylase 1
MRETPKAAAAYEEYAAMGPSRSLRKLAEKLDQIAPKVSPGIETLKLWSSEHRWQERVRLHDAECIEERRQKREAETEAMNSRHALIGTTQQAKAMKQIDELIKAQKFGSQAVVQLLKLALDIERLARGDATDRQEITGKDGGPLIIETQWGTKKVASQDGEEQ